MSDDEIWKVIVEHPDYEVSTHGRVRRRTPGQGAQAGRIRKPSIDRQGYYRMAFLISGRGRQTATGIHRLVLTTFRRPPHIGEQANHIDGRKDNNHVDNLEWITPSGNMRHAVETGLHVVLRGELHGRAKLTEDAVREIRASSSTHVALAGTYGVSQQTIGQIRRHENWKTVEEA